MLDDLTPSFTKDPLTIIGGAKNMVEKWLEAHILFSPHQISDFRTIKTILLEVLKYCARKLRQRGLMKTYHYFFEPRINSKPGLEVLFRV